MRCFVALDLPAPVRNHLVDAMQPLRARFRVKWVPVDQLHVTLVFAGDLDAGAVAPLADAVRTVVLPPLSLRLQGCGHFPPRGMPRVLWAGLGGDVEALAHLQAELAARATALGVPRERRAFVPHVTLGRVTTPFGALALVDELQRAGAMLRDRPFAPTELVLYASELRPGGPLHRPLASQRCSPPAG